MRKFIFYELRLIFKSYLFWFAIMISVLTCFFMAYQDIRVLPKNTIVLYFVFVGISISVSMSLLIIVSSMSTIRRYILDVTTNHHVFLKHRLGNVKYFLQLYTVNSFVSFCTGIIMLIIFIILLSFQFSLFTNENFNILNAVAGGHLFHQYHPFFTYLYFVWIVGLNFAFYQLLATFLTVLFPHDTMCYLYACIIWLFFDLTPMFDKIPFYFSPSIVFGLGNDFYTRNQMEGLSLSLWYPFFYFIGTFFVVMLITLVVNKLQQSHKYGRV